MTSLDATVALDDEDLGALAENAAGFAEEVAVKISSTAVTWNTFFARSIPTRAMFSFAPLRLVGLVPRHSGLRGRSE